MKQNQLFKKIKRYGELVTGSKKKVGQLEEKKTALDFIKNRYNAKYGIQENLLNMANDSRVRTNKYYDLEKEIYNDELNSLLERLKANQEYQDILVSSRSKIERTQPNAVHLIDTQNERLNRCKEQRNEILQDIEKLKAQPTIFPGQKIKERTKADKEYAKAMNAIKRKRERLNRGVGKNIDKTNKALSDELAAVKKARIGTGIGLGVAGSVGAGGIIHHYSKE